MRVLRYNNGFASELLARCKHFQVERLLLNTDDRKPAAFQTDSNSFQVLLCIDGNGVLSGEDTNLLFSKGDCIFVPADSVELMLQGKAEILEVRC